MTVEVRTGAHVGVEGGRYGVVRGARTLGVCTCPACASHAAPLVHRCDGTPSVRMTKTRTSRALSEALRKERAGSACISDVRRERMAAAHAPSAHPPLVRSACAP